MLNKTANPKKYIIGHRRYTTSHNQKTQRLIQKTQNWQRRELVKMQTAGRQKKKKKVGCDGIIGAKIYSMAQKRKEPNCDHFFVLVQTE